MGSICWENIDNRIHFPHSDMDIVMGGPYETFSSTNCLLSIHKKIILDMDAAMGDTSTFYIEIAIDGNTFNTFLNTPNIHFVQINYIFMVTDATTNVLASIIQPNIPMHKNMYLNYMLQIGCLLIHVNYLGSKSDYRFL